MTTLSRLFCACLVAVLAGCGGESEGPPPQAVSGTPPASPRAPQSRSSAQPVATTIQNTGNVDATLQQLTQALRDYVLRTRAVPKNFDEFAAKSGVTFPAAPAGKKYKIQGQAVVLDDN